MGVYNTEEMRRMYNLIESRLELQDRLFLQEMMEKFNGIARKAIKFKKYIQEHEKEYAEQMDQNCKLIERNQHLEDENKRYKNADKERLEYIKTLEKEVRDYKKLLDKLQTKEEG